MKAAIKKIKWEFSHFGGLKVKKNQDLITKNKGRVYTSLTSTELYVNSLI